MWFRVSQEQGVYPVYWERPVLKVCWEHKEQRVTKEILAVLEAMVPMEMMEQLELRYFSLSLCLSTCIFVSVYMYLPATCICLCLG